MIKTLIYTVAAAILAVAGFNTYLIASGQASPTTVVETVAVYAVILVLAGAAFVKAVGSPNIHLPSFGKKKTAEQDAWDNLDSKLDTLSEETDSLKDELHETADDIKDSIQSLRDRIDEPPTPDAWVATINSLDENGKLVKVYDLPPEDTVEEALASAHGSLMARDTEGRPVDNARITVSPVYF